MRTKRTKVVFNSNNNQLAGLLETPEQNTRGYALFAHCFTCGKDILAASRISQQLVTQGFAVLRFDFTGLGNSSGDFANANFSSNIDDLIAAANYLRENHQAPKLLIGHSLGGRAILSAAHQIAETAAVVTIGAPADAAHIKKQFLSHVDYIDAKGEAEVNLGGRRFTIKRQFLEDISQSNDDIEKLNTPLLVMHSPVDSIVAIEQAEHIYRRAKHPKSFISLDTADHLLTNKQDVAYVANMIAMWSEIFIPKNEIPATTSVTPMVEVTAGELVITEHDKHFTRTVISDNHTWLADEPESFGGANLGPDPYEHLLAALGACTSMTLRFYANREKFPLDEVIVNLKHSRKHGDDCQQCDTTNPKVELLEREIILKGDLTDEQRNRLAKIADRCPVHKTLEGKLIITTALLP